jgi:hypothetical protein
MKARNNLAKRNQMNPPQEDTTLPLDFNERQRGFGRDEESDRREASNRADAAQSDIHAETRESGSNG